jgi:hypothetical protein
MASRGLFINFPVGIFIEVAFWDDITTTVFLLAGKKIF